MVVSGSPRKVVGRRAVTGTERGLDLLLILLASPVIVLVGGLIALAVFADSPGPILYRARRIGKDGRPFRMLKFRKMRREAAGPILTRHDDERFTPIGRFLAVTKLDELPQVWNVITGEMRLVGPRPEVEEFIKLYGEEYREILKVLPGITGLAQLRYAGESQLFGDAHDSSLLYKERILPEKIALDLRYIASRSLLGDMAIVLATAMLPLTALRARLALRLRVRFIPPRRLPGYALLALVVLAMVGAFAVQAASPY